MSRPVVRDPSTPGSQIAFLVDFARLKWRHRFTWLPALLPLGPVDVDPFLIGVALRRIMSSSESRSAREGRRLIWNEYCFFLASSDYQRLRPLQANLRAELDTVFRDEIRRLQAKTVGDPILRFAVDRGNDLAPGAAQVNVAFLPNEDLAPDRPDEVTIRVGVDPPPGVVITDRVEDEPEGDTLTVAWGRGSVSIPRGEKRVLGRDHPQPPPSFVALTGASQRISSRHLALEYASKVVVTRLPGANPVQVANRPLQKGSKLAVPSLPVEITLSNGDLVLTLDHRRG